MGKLFKRILLSLIWLYRKIASPWVGQKCRFIPSCSQYSEDAINAYGPYKGLLLTIKRILRCQPWGGSGYDPVKLRNSENEKA